MGARSDFLYATPSFLEGAARIFDLNSTLNSYNGSPTEQYADGYAIGMDWYVVGHDIAQAVMQFENEHKISIKAHD